MEDATQSQCAHVLCKRCLKVLSDCPECHAKIGRRSQHDRKDLQQLFNTFLNLYSTFKVEYSSKPPVSRLLNIGGNQDAADPFDELLERLPEPSDPYRFISSQTDSQYFPKRVKKANKTYGRKKRTEEKTFDYKVLLKRKVPQIVNKVAVGALNKRTSKKRCKKVGRNLEIYESFPEFNIFGENQEKSEKLELDGFRENRENSENFDLNGFEKNQEKYDFGKIQEQPELIDLEKNRGISELNGFRKNQKQSELINFENNRNQSEIMDFEMYQKQSAIINSGDNQDQSEFKKIAVEVAIKIPSQHSIRSVENADVGVGSQTEKSAIRETEAENLPLSTTKDITTNDEKLGASVEQFETPLDLTGGDPRTDRPIVPQRSAIQFVELDIVLDLRLRFAIPATESSEDQDSQLSEIQIQSSECSQLVLSSHSQSQLSQVREMSNSNENNMVLPEQRLKIAVGIGDIDGPVSVTAKQIQTVDEPLKINSVRVKGKRVSKEPFATPPPPKKKLRPDLISSSGVSGSRLEGQDKTKSASDEVTCMPDSSDVEILPDLEESLDAHVHCTSPNGKPARSNSTPNLEKQDEVPGTTDSNRERNRRLILTPNLDDNSILSALTNVRDGRDNQTNDDVTPTAATTSLTPRGSASTLQNSPSSRSQNFIFCPTRLSREQLLILRKLSGICGGRIVKNYTNEVTHLILNLETERVPQTMKYLFAIAGQKWVVIFDWVEECVKQNRIVSEERYETSNFSQCDRGVRKSRLAKSPLFKGFTFHIAGHMKSSGTSINDCKKLLTQMGGNIILDANVDKEECVIIVGDPFDNSVDYQKWFDTNGWLTISWEWILDCILTYTLVPFSQSHLLTNVVGKKLLKAKVPPQLLKAQEM